jgi:hypothetical protein
MSPSAKKPPLGRDQRRLPFASVTTRQEALFGELTRRKLRVESHVGKRSGAHWIEQAARAITGRLIPQLPALRRFHR